MAANEPKVKDCDNPTNTSIKWIIGVVAFIALLIFFGGGHHHNIFSGDVRQVKTEPPPSNERWDKPRSYEGRGEQRPDMQRRSRRYLPRNVYRDSRGQLRVKRPRPDMDGAWYGRPDISCRGRRGQRFRCDNGWCLC